MWGQHACTHMQNRLCAHNPRLHKGVCVHVCIREGQGGARTSASYLVQSHLHVKQLKLAQPVLLHSPSWPTGHFCLSGNTVAVSCIWVLFLQACPPGLPSRLALQACPPGLPSRLALQACPPGLPSAHLRSSFSHLLPGQGRIRCLPPVASGSLSASSSSSPEKISPIMCKLWSII